MRAGHDDPIGSERSETLGMHVLVGDHVMADTECSRNALMSVSGVKFQPSAPGAGSAPVAARAEHHPLPSGCFSYIERPSSGW